MPTPSGVTTLNPIYVEANVQVVRNPSGELVAPVGVGAGQTPPETPTTRTYPFAA